MADQRICAAVQSGISSNSSIASRVQSALDNAASRLTNFTSYDYESYGPQDHNWYPSVPEPINDLGAYMENFGDELKSGSDVNDINLVPGDCWILIDSNWQYGYGDGGLHYTWDYSSTVDSLIHLGRSISCESAGIVPDPNKTTKKIVKHNLGHCFDIHHNMGDYNVINGEAYAGTPMSHSYVRVNHDDPSEKSEFDALVCFEGSADPPGSFSNIDNWTSYDRFGSDCTHSDRSTEDYSSYALLGIRDNTPRPSYIYTS